MLTFFSEVFIANFASYRCVFSHLPAATLLSAIYLLVCWLLIFQRLVLSTFAPLFFLLSFPSVVTPDFSKNFEAFISVSALVGAFWFFENICGKMANDRMPTSRCWRNFAVMLISKTTNNRHSRTATFSVNVVDKKWSNKQQIIFTNKPNLTKNISMETLSKRFKPIASEFIQFRLTKNIN